jgi:Zn-dependent protease
MPTRRGSFHLFKLFGIDVYLHWSWFLAAIVIYEIQVRKGFFNSVIWNVLEYLTLFLIVLTHEFGHALACRSVGGRANQIVLWPFGGVAYVSPPQRPGAVLWSIVAGPLVNVVLVPIFSVIWWLGYYHSGWSETHTDLINYIDAVWFINVVLLVFNILPIYPLDGGKILYALLWFVLGQARSLLVATVLGFIGILGLAIFAIFSENMWLGAVCVIIGLNCYQGFQSARELLRISKAPRREGYHCPECKAAPPIGDLWSCRKCRKKFDLFGTQFTCPHCNTQYGGAVCFDCGVGSRLEGWMDTPPSAPPVLPAAQPPPS